MELKFNGLTEGDVYKYNVIIVNGRYEIFNSILRNNIRSWSRVRIDGIIDSGFDINIEKFTGVEKVGEHEIYANAPSIEFETFIKSAGIPSVHGKKICIEEYSVLNSKQREMFDTYIKGKIYDDDILVCFVSDFKDVIKYKRMKWIKYSDKVCLIDLNYPKYQDINNVIKGGIDKGIRIDENALRFIIDRIGKEYDSLIDVINRINIGGYTNNISYEDAKDIMYGIDNYDINDLLVAIIHSSSSKKPRSAKLYKAINYVVSDIGARKVVNKIRRSIDELIEVRQLINNGTVPIGLRYNINKVIDGIGNDSKLYNISNLRFVRLVNIAKDTSLEDLVYIKMMLRNVRGVGEYNYERILYSIAMRRSLNGERLATDIGVKSIDFDDVMEKLNRKCLKTR